MSPLVKYLTRGVSDALGYEGTKRSIVRYLERYEREWGRRVWIREHQMAGCRPPEEGGLCMVSSRVGRAIRDLVREGILIRHERHACWRLRDSIWDLDEPPLPPRSASPPSATDGAP